MSNYNNHDTAITLLKRDDVIEEVRKNAVLPASVDAGRWIRVLQTSLNKNPDLLRCSKLSLLTALHDCASLGLWTDTISGHAYLLPFRKGMNGDYECQLIVGYRGLLHMVLKDDDGKPSRVRSVKACVVYENELNAGQFEYEEGTSPYIKHKPFLTDPGPMVAAYAHAVMDTGEIKFDVMRRDEIFSIRDNSKAWKGYQKSLKYYERDLEEYRAGRGKKYEPTEPDTPWKSSEGEMVKKTVLRRLCKTLPMSHEVNALLERDDDGDVRIRGHQSSGPRMGKPLFTRKEEEAEAVEVQAEEVKEEELNEAS